MSQQVVAETFKHNQTGKIHLVNVGFPPQMWHCYCSLRRYEEPVEREVNLDDEDVCSTCASGYRERHGTVEEQETEQKQQDEDDDEESVLSTSSSGSESALASTDSALD